MEWESGLIEGLSSFLVDCELGPGRLGGKGLPTIRLPVPGVLVPGVRTLVPAQGVAVVCTNPARPEVTGARGSVALSRP